MLAAMPSRRVADGPVGSSRSISKAIPYNVPPAEVDQVAAGQIPPEESTAHYRLSLPGLQRQNLDVCLLPVRDIVARREHDGFSPRQQLRPAVGRLAVFEFGERLRRSAVLGNSRKSGLGA